VRTIVFTHQVLTGQVFQVVHNDLTAEPVEAIVNAANEQLAHGGGVAGAISRRGGPAIQRESSAWVRDHGPVPTGSAAITSAGELSCRYLIHAVGPVWGSGDEESKLASAVRSALVLADRHGAASISIPGISSGIFGFPKPLCAQVMIRTIRAWLEGHPASTVREVNACNIDARTTDIFCREAKAQFAATEGGS
jgi:O-acetyl-ADP-ribose deacetylase (regulator of RNase III)